jgi:DnaJ like chaperone protein
MSVWTRILEALKALASGESLSAIFDRLRTPPERTVAFTIAIISLSAKMAKADGEVTRDEVRAFRRIFTIAPGDEVAAARVFNLARQDIAGFDQYARQIGRMFAEDPGMLESLLEGLFAIAVADGDLQSAEHDFLSVVAREWRIGDKCFRAIRGRFAPDHAADPYDVLGVDPGLPVAEIRDRWRALVRETHPDRLIAHGVPEEAVKLATARLAAINDAWEAIQSRHRAA